MTGANVLEKSNTVQPKINRLKRPKRSGRSRSSDFHRKEIPSVKPEETESYSFSEMFVNCGEAGSEFAANDKTFSFNKTTKETSMRFLTKGSSNCSPKLNMLPLRRSLKQSKLKMSTMKSHCLHLQLSVPKSANAVRLHIGDSDPDIIDLCGDESSCEHSSEQLPVVTCIIEQGCHGKRDPPEATMEDTRTVSSVTSENLTERTGRRAEFSQQIREELLKQIQDRNLNFPTYRFISQLLNQRSDFEKENTSLGTIKTITGPITTDYPVPGKRKQEVSSHGEGRPPKRMNPSRDLGSDGARVGVVPSVSASGNPKGSHISRLSMSSRKKQVTAATAASEPLPLPPVSERQDDEVLWTEKYQPRHSSEVMGNSAAVRKLHSWLAEWRIRADVEERSKRGEDRQKKAESSELWDRGDFKGELGSAESGKELRNAVLIQGPCGVGKTAAVYACARELGFKVFEVNSSSLRRGQLILSQLSEATQSHQVGAPPCAALPPPKAGTSRPAVASRKEASRKVIASSRKRHESSHMVSRKRHGIVPCVTLNHFFKSTGTCKKSTCRSQNTQSHCGAPDEVKPDVITPTTAEGSDITEHVLLSEDPVLDRKNTKPPLSLILFEEVDVIFDVDVGFLTAVKTLISITKRPVILTTSDPLFCQSFDGHFEEIHFKRPPMENIGSYLQCLCVVENMQPDPENISFLLAENKGDIRRSILELELWARSGGGDTPYKLHKRALACRSRSELESTGCLEVLVDSWRMGRSLFCSDPVLLLAPPSTTPQCADQSTAETVGPTFPEMLGKGGTSSSLAIDERRSRKLSRQKRRKSAGDGCKVTSNQCSKYATLLPDRQTGRSAGETGDLPVEESLSKLVSCSMDSLARFFETMSFLDSSLCRRLSGAAGRSGPASLGAGIADGLVDEPREEDVSPLDLESSYELLAVVEGLGFFCCRAEMTETRRRAPSRKERGGGKTWGTELTALRSPGESCTFLWQNEPYKPRIIQNSKEVLSKVLSSKAFCCHGNKKAVAMDYLPALRSICRLERMKQRDKPRPCHYLRGIQLPLSNSTLQLLASDVYLQQCW